MSAASDFGKKVVVRFGITLVLGSAALLGLQNKWEEGGKKIPEAGYRVYADKLAKGLPTACHGITGRATDEPVIVGDVWSVDRCERVLADVVSKTQYGLLDCIQAPMSQNTFDAMSSFAWNVGIPAACGSRAAALIEAGNLVDGCRAIAYTPDGRPNWSNASGKFVQGLHNRRKDEAALCLKP